MKNIKNYLQLFEIKINQILKNSNVVESKNILNEFNNILSELDMKVEYIHIFSNDNIYDNTPFFF
jgi:hypothetical protein